LSSFHNSRGYDRVLCSDRNNG